jgi:hypothetical protein
MARRPPRPAFPGSNLLTFQPLRGDVAASPESAVDANLRHPIGAEPEAPSYHNDLGFPSSAMAFLLLLMHPPGEINHLQGPLRCCISPTSARRGSKAPRRQGCGTGTLA